MDKFFDKIVYSNIFMKIVALALALLLFSSVYDGTKEFSDINVPGDQDSAILEDISVKSYYDTDNLVVTGIPDTVKVTLEGPTSHLQPAKTQKNFEVFVDLSKAQIGTTEVPLEVKDISDKLKVTIEPEMVKVTIQEKVTKEFKVEAEFNSTLIKDGFIYEAPVVEPNMVKITGAKDEIDKITYVKANVELQDAFKETITKEAEITVLDKNLNKLAVTAEPAKVKVTIPVKTSSKTVPIKIVENGSPPDGLKIESITLNVDDAVIFGNEAILKKVENVRVEVDLRKINGDTELSLPVIISNGITEVNPELVTAKIKVRLQEEVEEVEVEEVEETVSQNFINKTITKLPIGYYGLDENYEVIFKTPVNGFADLKIIGEESQINNLDQSDFSLFIDLTSLSEGEHSVDINVKGPENIQWELLNGTASISISQKEA